MLLSAVGLNAGLFQLPYLSLLLLMTAVLSVRKMEGEICSERGLFVTPIGKALVKCLLSDDVASVSIHC